MGPYLVTAADMRKVDEQAERMGVPSLILMENAGSAVAKEADRLLERPSFVAVLAGPGKNGGDGLCAARHLSSLGHKVRVAFFHQGHALPRDVKANVDMLGAYPVKVDRVGQGFEADQYRGVDLILDALLGTGLRGSPRFPMDEAVEWVNSSGTTVLSCDLPSGLCADSGHPFEPTVRADVTVTMGLPKVGLYSYPGRKYAGDIKVAPLPFPPSAIGGPFPCRLMTKGLARELMPVRQKDHHKGMSGHVLVIAGSLGMAGAAAMSARAALRAGAGTVTLLCPRSIYSVVAPMIPEVMVVPCGGAGSAGFDDSAVGVAKELLHRSHAVVVGPGMGRGESQNRFLEGLLPSAGGKPCVLDADGLFSLGELGGLSYLKALGGKFILTPHTKELARLLGVSVQDIERDRPGYTRTTAKDGFSVACLKGAGTLVANQEGELVVNTTGDEAMATAGSGDVLTGVIAAAASQGLPAFEAACLGVFWHGLAGEIAAGRAGSYGMLASEIGECLPKARHTIDGR